MSTAGDMFAQSLVDMASAYRENQTAEHNLRERQAALAKWQAQWQAALDSANQDNAANVAEKMALRQQLERFCPNHPLLKNRQLIEKIQDLGARAYAISKNFDDARKVGESYFPPDTPVVK